MQPRVTAQKQNERFWSRESAAWTSTRRGFYKDTVELRWGLFATPEDSVNALGDVSGLDILELGSGSGEWAVRLAGRGARRVVGVDISAPQVRSAKRLAKKRRVVCEFMQADATDTPFPAGSFDLILSDYGALSYADPYKVVPEASRLLRVGGLLVFNMATPIVVAEWWGGADDYLDMHQFNDGRTIQYQLPYGAWVRLFRRKGFVIEDLIELPTTVLGFPIENVWKVRRAV